LEDGLDEAFCTLDRVASRAIIDVENEFATVNRRQDRFASGGAEIEPEDRRCAFGAGSNVRGLQVPDAMCGGRRFSGP
jgi:hypothetical protein